MAAINGRKRVEKLVFYRTVAVLDVITISRGNGSLVYTARKGQNNILSDLLCFIRATLVHARGIGEKCARFPSRVVSENSLNGVRKKKMNNC